MRGGFGRVAPSAVPALRARGLAPRFVAPRCGAPRRAGAVAGFPRGRPSVRWPPARRLRPQRGRARPCPSLPAASLLVGLVRSGRGLARLFPLAGPPPSRPADRLVPAWSRGVPSPLPPGRPRWPGSVAPLPRGGLGGALRLPPFGGSAAARGAGGLGFCASWFFGGSPTAPQPLLTSRFFCGAPRDLERCPIKRTIYFALHSIITKTPPYFEHA